jgi:hypothetical protein
MTIQQLSKQIGHSVDTVNIAVKMTVEKMNPMKIQSVTGLNQSQYCKLITWYSSFGWKSNKRVLFEKSEKKPEVESESELQPFGFSYESLSPAEKKLYNKKYTP